jgi:hypothetical protein
MKDKRKNIKVSAPIFEELERIRKKKNFLNYPDVITYLILNENGREDKKTDI